MPRCQRLISRQSRLLPHILLHQEHYPLISCWNSDDLAASLYLYFKTADPVQHQQYCKIKKQPILLCRDIWPYIFFLTLWKIESCASPDDTVLEVQTAHCKQLLWLCSTPAVTLCMLTSFSIDKTLPLSQNCQHQRCRLPLLWLTITSNIWIWSSRPGAESPYGFLPMLLGKGASLCHWGNSTLSCTVLAGCDGSQWQ